MTRPPNLRITSDDINALVYSYLEDAGFQHTSYALRHEARLDSSPNLNVRIPRGELIKLLNKALLYTEAEAHFRRDGNNANEQCTAPFSILKPHVCSSGPNLLPSPPEMGRRRPELFPPPIPTSPAPSNSNEKRKASPAPEAPRVEKRARTEEESIQEIVSASGVRVRKGYSEGVILMNGHESEVFVCGWHPLKTNVLVTGSKDGAAKLWNVPIPPAPLYTPVTLRHVPEPGEAHDITAVEWDRTGARLATGCYDGVVRVWTAEGAHQFNLRIHNAPMFAVKWSADGSYLLTASLDGNIAAWDMMTLKPDKLQQLFRIHKGPVLDACWLDAKTFVSCSTDKKIHISRIGESRPLRTFQTHEREVGFVRMSKDNTLLASGSEDSTVRLWDIAKWQSLGPHSVSAVPPDAVDPIEKFVLKGHVREVACVQWAPAPNAHIVVSSSMDNTARLWDSRNGSCIKELLHHRDKVYTITFSPAGRYVATGAADGRVLVYDMATGQLLFDWACGTGGIYEIEWQKTGDQLAACLENRGVAVLDMKKLGMGDFTEPPLPPPATV